MAFQQLKEYLSRPSTISSPKVDEVLFAYLAVAPHAVSFVLIREDSGIQRPAYYVSKSLHEAEMRYLSLEKAILLWSMQHANFHITFRPILWLF